MSHESTPAVPVGNTYDKYASQNPIEKAMMRRFLATLDRMVEGLQPTNLLEVGVGEGEILQRMAARFPAATVLGLDLPDEHLAEEWRRRGLPAEFGDVTALRFADGEFDLVMAIEVLEHVPEPDAALAELARVCSGTVVLSVPSEPIWRIGNMARGRYVREWGNTPGHVNHWGRRSFRRAVSRHFEVEAGASTLPWTMLRATPRRVG